MRIKQRVQLGFTLFQLLVSIAAFVFLAGLVALVGGGVELREPAPLENRGPIGFVTLSAPSMIRIGDTAEMNIRITWAPLVAPSPPPAEPPPPRPEIMVVALFAQSRPLFASRQAVEGIGVNEIRYWYTPETIGDRSLEVQVSTPELDGKPGIRLGTLTTRLSVQSAYYYRITYIKRNAVALGTVGIGGATLVWASIRTARRWRKRRAFESLQRIGRVRSV